MMSKIEISITSEGRGGDVVLRMGDATARFWWEFAGGDAVAIINVPSPEMWEAHTGIPSGERDRVLEDVAKQTVQKKAAGCRYEIGDQFITIYQT
jgi:hypothetical protein